MTANQRPLRPSRITDELWLTSRSRSGKHNVLAKVVFSKLDICSANASRIKLRTCRVCVCIRESAFAEQIIAHVHTCRDAARCLFCYIAMWDEDTLWLLGIKELIRHVSNAEIWFVCSPVVHNGDTLHLYGISLNYTLKYYCLLVVSEEKKQQFLQLTDKIKPFSFHWAVGNVNTNLFYTSKCCKCSESVVLLIICMDFSATERMVRHFWCLD